MCVYESFPAAVKRNGGQFCYAPLRFLRGDVSAMFFLNGGEQFRLLDEVQRSQCHRLRADDDSVQPLLRTGGCFECLAVSGNALVGNADARLDGRF